MMLKLRSLTKVFLRGTPDERTAVSDLSLDVKQGDFITIIGGNGAGKSTLFNLVSGAEMPDGGTILLEGADVTGQNEHSRAKSIGRLYQDPSRGTAPGMTIEENLSLAFHRGKRRGLGPGLDKRNRAFFQDTLAQLELGLEDRMGAKVGTLSGGQRQAVTLLMATIAVPKLLLLDEHTAALDPATADKVMGLTNRIVREHSITTLMITHNIEIALSTGNRTLMMDAGRIALNIEGAERNGLTVDGALQMFREHALSGQLSDRTLLS